MKNDLEKFLPLGPAVEKPKPDPKPEWLPTGTPGIERNDKGQLRNVQPTPPEPMPWSYPVIVAMLVAGCASPTPIQSGPGASWMCFDAFFYGKVVTGTIGTDKTSGSISIGSDCAVVITPKP